MTAFHSRDLRKGRRSEAGRAYLVTIATHQRVPRFASFPAARCVVGAMRHLQEIGRVRSLCFVIMPDHVHWLFVLGETTDLSSVINAMKAMASRRIHRLSLNAGQTWQRGFHDRAVRRDEDIRRIARYVVANPLRAGLVKEIGDYPHWDAAWL